MTIYTQLSIHNYIYTTIYTQLYVQKIVYVYDLINCSNPFTQRNQLSTKFGT